MADIKTRDVVKGTIKKIDKAAIAADRMRSAYVQTKEKAEHTTHPDEHNAEEYASDRVEGGVDRITHEAVHQFDKQGRKGLEDTKRNVSKAKDGVQRFREKRAAESMKRQTVRTSGNKTIKAVEQTEKTIKQSAGSAGKKAIKTAGKGTAKAAQRSVKTTKTAIKTTQQAAKTAQKTAQATVKASQKAAQAAKAAAKATVAGVKAAVKATIAAVKAIIAATKALVAAIAAGGWVAVAVIVVICLIALICGSVFGIFFSGEDSGTGYTMPEAVTMLNTEFTDRIEQIKAENPHDELDMDNAGSAAMISNWRDVLAVYAVRTTTDASSPDEVATLTEEKLDILRQIFWDMNAISYWVETISGDKDESDTVILHITVTVKDHLQMADEYRFNAEQHKLLEELMQPEYQELFAALTGSYQDIELSPDEVAKIMENLPADLSEARREVVLTAYQLLGRVHYFWGGKSLVIGWDSRWGMPMEVTAEGSSTTGTVRPFGLDCSGMVDWVFYNQSGGQYVIGHGGGATAQHSYCTPIDWSDAQPGDLVFYPEDSHVGIVCGFDGSGNVLIIHCASSENNVVVTGKSGFTSIGRPEYFAD